MMVIENNNVGDVCGRCMWKEGRKMVSRSQNLRERAFGERDAWEREMLGRERGFGGDESGGDESGGEGRVLKMEERR